MRFYAPQILWTFLPLVAGLAVVWVVLEKKAAERFAQFAAAPMLKLMLRGGEPRLVARRRRSRFVLGMLALACAVVALARPQLGVREETIPSEGLDMVFMLDVSNSMLTEDIVPSRLKKAKHIIKNFVDRLSGDRAGIVAFAGSAYPAVPLTTDYDFIRQTLDVLDENSVANQGTDLGKALNVSKDLLLRGGLSDDTDAAHEQQEKDQSSRVLVVVSDGEDHEGEEAKVIPKLKEAGIKVFCIGVGSVRGGPIPLRDETGYMHGYKKDSSGNMVYTKLETANLEGLASKTGGKYYSASSNEGEVEEILGQLSSFARSQGGGRKVIVYDEIYQYPLGLGIFLLLLMLFLRDTRREGMPVATAALALFVLAAMPRSAHAGAKSIGEYSSTKKGLEAYGDKDYAEAVQDFGKAQAANPDSMVHHMNLGDALLKSGSIEGALPEFQAVMKSKDATEAARGAYNLGKSYEQAKDYEHALRAYQDGLTRLGQDPKSDPEVETRIKRALEQAHQKKQQQSQSQNSNQNNNQGNGKDSKNDQQNDDKKKNDQNKKYDIPKKKQSFKGEKMNESDANRILKQLQEEEKKSQQRVMRAKTGKPKDDKIEKDW